MLADNLAVDQEASYLTVSPISKVDNFAAFSQTGAHTRVHCDPHGQLTMFRCATGMKVVQFREMSSDRVPRAGNILHGWYEGNWTTEVLFAGDAM
jgi:hypothetical protein